MSMASDQPGQFVVFLCVKGILLGGQTVDSNISVASEVAEATYLPGCVA